MKNIIIPVITAFLAFIGAILVNNQPNLEFRASPGPAYLNTQYFYAGLINGGPLTSKAVTSTTTFTAAEICDSGILAITGGSVANTSTTLPTSAALISRCFQKDGDKKTIIFYNRGSAASTTALEAGTAMKLFFPEVTGANGVIAGGNSAILEFFRASSTAVYVNVLEQVVQ